MRWYHSQLAGLDERFLKAVITCERLIHQFPKGAPVVHKDLRQVPLKGFPYVILYGVWHDELVIYRVFHTSQHPKKKFTRKK